MSHALPARSARRAPRSRMSRMRGASLTEFVIVGPVAILFTFLILQSGMLYMAKLTLNTATFMAARNGATENASPAAIRISLIKGLIPFYQDATNTSDVGRLSAAAAKAAIDTVDPRNLSLEVLSPSKEAFQAYGIRDGNTTYIPNDNLEFRTATPVGGGNLSIRDANVLRIKVTYGYQLKVPLMKAVISRVMCPFAPRSDVRAWDKPGLLPLGVSTDCFYYMNGRVPLVSFATVQMQSRPQQ